MITKNKFLSIAFAYAIAMSNIAYGAEELKPKCVKTHNKASITTCLVEIYDGTVLTNYCENIEKTPHTTLEMYRDFTVNDLKEAFLKKNPDFKQLLKRQVPKNFNKIELLVMPYYYDDPELSIESIAPSSWCNESGAYKARIVANLH